MRPGSPPPRPGRPQCPVRDVFDRHRTGKGTPPSCPAACSRPPRSPPHSIRGGRHIPPHRQPARGWPRKIHYNPNLIDDRSRDLGGCSVMGKSSAGQDGDRRARIAAQRAAQQRARTRNRLLIAGGAIVVVVAVVLALVLLHGSGGGQPAASGSPGPTGASLD